MSIRGKDENANSSWNGITDEKGEFAITVKGPGRYELTASRGPTKTTLLELEVGTTPGPRLMIELPVTAPVARLAGKASPAL